MADGNWHRVEGHPNTLRPTLSAWSRSHGYKARTQVRPDGLYVRMDPAPGGGQQHWFAAPAEDFRARMADAHDGMYPDPPFGAVERAKALGRTFTPDQWFALMEAGRYPDGTPPIRHMNAATLNSLAPRYLSRYHKSLTPAGLRLLGREGDAAHLERTGAECLADLTDSTFHPL